MSAETVLAAKYARALFQLAQEQNQIERVAQELRLADSAFGRGDGRNILIHPRMTLDKKMAVVRNVLGEALGPLTLRFLQLLIAKGRSSLLEPAVAAYQKEWQQRLGRVQAVVTSAAPLSAEQLALLGTKLRALTGHEVEVEIRTDTAVQGGMQVRMGDLLLDGTLAGRLKQLRRILMPEN